MVSQYQTQPVDTAPIIQARQTAAVSPLKAFAMITWTQLRKSKVVTWSLRSKAFILACIVLLILFQFASKIAHIPYEIRRHLVLASVGSHPYNATSVHSEPILLPNATSKYAFATFLTGGDDHYFVATRILTYQLLHAQDTRSADQEIPFIVLVTDSVVEEDRARLRKDGAIVVEQDVIREAWVLPGVERWSTVLTKLRFWQFTQFERICFLDGDTVLVHPLDGIFDDEAVLSQESGHNEKYILADEAALPAKYSFASTPALAAKHHYPPTEAGHDFRMDYLNAGIFVLQPDVQMFNYYLSVLNTPNKFHPEYPEQNLLNYAHRKEGNMPWTQLNYTWNIHHPTKVDLDGGVKSLHEKFWSPAHGDMQPYLNSWRWKMEGYFQAMDEELARQARDV